MTDHSQRIQDIKSRAEKATEGPWDTDRIQTDDGRGKYWSSEVYTVERAERVCDMQNADVALISEGDGSRFDDAAAANADFIAHARSDVPWLLFQLDASLARERALREALGACKGYMLNGVIDLQTGTKKQTTINTLTGGIRIIDAALQGKD